MEGATAATQHYFIHTRAAGVSVTVVDGELSEHHREKFRGGTPIAELNLQIRSRSRVQQLRSFHTLSPLHTLNPPQPPRNLTDIPLRHLIDTLPCHALPLKTSRPLPLQPTRDNAIKPPQIRAHIQPYPMARDIPPHVHTNRGNLIVGTCPHPRMLRRHSLDTIICTRSNERLLQQTDVVAGGEFVRAQVDDGVCDELARAVERRLAAAHGFDEGGAAICAEIGLLVWRDGANFPAATGVDGCELGGYDVWGRCGRVRGRLRGEEARDEGFLETSGGRVGRYAGEVDVPEDLRHCVLSCGGEMGSWGDLRR